MPTGRRRPVESTPRPAGGLSGLPYLPCHHRLRELAGMTSVLVVDDDPSFRRLAGQMLADFGLAVVGNADTVRSALVAAGELRPDAVLVDVGLPDGDGIALAGELAALPWKPRVVLTSTNADAAGETEVRRSRAEAFIPKAQLLNAELDRLLGARAP
jgi:CheY-like chemotaxis protein